MTPRQLLADHSIEITARDLAALSTAQKCLRPATRIAITFLPGDEPDALVRAAARVHELGLTPVPHLSARRIASAQALERFLVALRRAAQVDSVFVIAGDPAVPIGPFADALALIRSGALAQAGIRHVGIAGYPQGHPDIPAHALASAMHDKLAALAAAGHDAEIVTQFAFDAPPILAWLDALRAGHVQAPVRLGLAGPASVPSLLRFAARCGVAASAQMLSRQGSSLAKLLGTATPAHLANALAQRLEPRRHGKVKVHLYPFGGVDKLVDWLDAFESTPSR